jgi:hypothetical protein
MPMPMATGNLPTTTSSSGSNKTWVYVFLGLTLVAVLGVGLYFFMKQQKSSSSNSHASNGSGSLSFKSPRSWEVMPAHVRAKAEESFQRIATYYVTQRGLEPLDAQLKAVEDVENHIRAQMMQQQQQQQQAPAAPHGPKVSFNDVVKVDPSEVDGMVQQQRESPHAHVSEEESIEMEKMRPKQRMAMETKKRAESMAAMRDTEQGGRSAPSRPRPQAPANTATATDENFTPL